MSVIILQCTYLYLCSPLCTDISINLHIHVTVLLRDPLTSVLFPFQIHWFSIFNSFMMVVFLVGLVAMILMRTLRKDYARYSRDDDLDELVSEILGSQRYMYIFRISVFH